MKKVEETTKEIKEVWNHARTKTTTFKNLKAGGGNLQSLKSKIKTKGALSENPETPAPVQTDKTDAHRGCRAGESCKVA
jgi:hypothetical protein